MDLPGHILKIMDLAGGDPPFGRLQRGKPVAGAKEAVASSGLSPLAQGALYLYFDCFEEAHHVANDHEGTWQGNWIHAILHRREPDAGNSKYWYARVKAPEGAYRSIGVSAMRILGKDPPKVLTKLAEKVQRSRLWEPELFTDLCDKFRVDDPGPVPYRALVALQDAEWRGLLKAVLV